MMHAEGFEQFDLTPGGDTYKERFANAADEAHVLTVLPTPAARARTCAVWRTQEATKRVLRRFGLTIAEAKFHVRRLRQQPLRVAKLVLAAARKWIGSNEKLHINVRDMTVPVHHRTSISVQRDALEDLLLYRPADGGVGGESRQEFLSRALRRLESGQHAYTVADGGRLRCCIWLDEHPGSDLEDVGSLPGFSLPPDSALIHDYRSFGPQRELPSSTDVLRTILTDVAAVKGIRQAVLAAKGNDELLSQAASRLSFQQALTLTRIIRIGKRRWVNARPGSGLLPQRHVASVPADVAASSGALSKHVNVEAIETAGAV
jgi:hypothetical protein